jgi:ligand-binding SRPBCC domain-containing protein
MIRRLEIKQFVPRDLDEVWDFFSSPANLNAITPEDMNFEILGNVPKKMYPGLFISYKVRPLLNIPLDWTTEITHVEDKKYFVDEQRIGPYNIWHHEHHFEAKDGGVMMTDILHYDIGKSIFGSIAGALFVHKRVNEIFRYREEKLKTLFP